MGGIADDSYQRAPRVRVLMFLPGIDSATITIMTQFVCRRVKTFY